MTLALILSLVLNVILAGLSLFQLKALEKKDRKQERERSAAVLVQTNLIDRLMHKEGVTWTPAPRPVQDEILIDDETKAALEGWREV